MSLIIREAEIKITMTYHLPLVRMAIIYFLKKKKKRTSVGEDVEKLVPLYTVGGNITW